MYHTPQAGDETAFAKVIRAITDVVEKPVIWFRETIVVPNRKEYPWYHEQVRRVPTVDECDVNDAMCIFEADQQFMRDRMVDGNILHILKRRFENCCYLNEPDHKEACDGLYQVYLKSATNFHIKYGDLKYSTGSKEAYMKQKHRMIWERRHGPVGTGMKDQREKNEH
ncbi:UNVERIFIED_CONTAM: hypothetical protein PYX00_001073 [Menopon gallinae]|uniref:NADH dehydrogenase [ubiquinone] 1 beta subcomplex subunit 10 n=1 Tax=Menopon gallinae TaxID=328185 RepID=A0AAW2ICW1_9NEOP